ncbi:SMC family ATPase [Dehalogenimonas sp. THU2]|uniref:SMC family ATPase n=1 Tax=Dehalogenimonas sp. THU2 TaxID=3151121 RepID=UPI0032185C33
MIPVRLKLKNFLPYRGDIPAFSFEGIHLACISGDNGSGKTSLIDAITWALWGKSRLRSKSTSDDDLITQGEYETSVAFDFRAGDGQIYRVERKRTKPKRAGGAGQSVLNLFLESEEGFKSLSGNTIGETGDKIKKILHLDYETFINSAYLKQGQADHFTELRPGDRKEVLANILGLDIYDELSEKAKNLANEAAAAKNMHAASIELERRQLEEHPQLTVALKTAQHDLSAAETALLEKRTALDKLRQVRQLIESREQALRQLEASFREIERDLETRKLDRIETEKRIALHRAVLDGRVAVEEGYSRYLAARQRNDEYNRRSTELRRLETRRQALEKIITDSLHKLESTRDRYQSVYDELSTKASGLGKLKLALDEMRLEIEKLAVRERQAETEIKTLHNLKVQIASLDAEKVGQVRRLTEIAERSGLLASAGEAVCPVCEAELREDRLKIVQAKYEADRVAAQARLNDLAAARSDKLNELTALERHLAQENAIKADRARLTAQEARVLKDTEEAEAAARRLPEGAKQIGAITGQIERAGFCPEEHAALKTLDEEIRLLDYDASAHELTAAEVKELEIFDRRQGELAEADKLLAGEVASLKKVFTAITDLEQRLEKRAADVAEQQQALARMPRVDAGELVSLEAGINTLASAAGAASEQVGRLKQRLQDLDDLEKAISEKALELKRYAADESIYKELQLAFGRNGIQAILIENAIPEMEEEANRLLARMTDNRMSLKIEPMRTSKKGDMIETFDIMIADELGTRDYDLFSGGEAFRINFALRLALSRLLARRAGAPLRTLIIDEGFGTQDVAGIDKLKDAIGSIQDQFDCILVITHIEEFKDAFPARIEVFKTPDGSNIRVSYN